MDYGHQPRTNLGTKKTFGAAEKKVEVDPWLAHLMGTECHQYKQPITEGNAERLFHKL